MKSHSPGLDGRNQRVGDGCGAHLGSEVVGGDVAARRNEDALLPGEGLLDAAVEEVRDVGVLLRLGNVQLTPPEPGQVSGQRVDGDGREADADRELVGGLVLGEGGDGQRWHRLAVEGVEVGRRARACVSCRARSARKFRCTTASPSAIGRAASRTVGWMNSSPSPRS